MPSTSPSALAATRAKVRQQARVNGYLTCAVPSCGRFRHALGRFCKRHQRRRERFGHPEAGPVPAAALARHLRWWRRFLAMNAEHAEVRAAVARLDRLIRGDVRDAALALSWRDHRVPRGTRAQLKRLREAGLTGAEVLPTLGALNRLAYSEDPLDVGVLPDDDRYTVALGRALIQSRPRKRHAREVSGTIAMALGRHLRSALAPLFASVELEARKQRRRTTEAERESA